MANQADKLVSVRDLEPGDEFAHKGSMWTVMRKEEDRIEVRGQQFSNIVTFFNPTRVFDGPGPTWYTKVKKFTRN